jgi:hypothetical protein
LYSFSRKILEKILHFQSLNFFAEKLILNFIDKYLNNENNLNNKNINIEVIFIEIDNDIIEISKSINETLNNLLKIKNNDINLNIKNYDIILYSGNIEILNELLKEYPDEINWNCVSENPNAIDLLKENPLKIDWTRLSQNPSIFTYDYEKMRENMLLIKEDLMKERFHPRNLRKFSSWGHSGGIDDE